MTRAFPVLLPAPLHPPRFFSSSAQRGKQLGAVDILKGTVFDTKAMPEDKQARQCTLCPHTNCLWNCCRVDL